MAIRGDPGGRVRGDRESVTSITARGRRRAKRERNCGSESNVRDTSD